MMQEDNFSYNLASTEVSNENRVKSLRETARRYRAVAFISLVEAAAIPYAAEKFYQIFPEPWNNTAYSGMLLLELLVVGNFLHSGYNWWKHSKQAGELEKIIGVGNKK
ncbi:MAG TPA: hypothetical protein VJA18_05755 [Candidatus Nanoarchaeia archaeon]|nr:hypothetical protein [Candidatus Nanoarchaeia archaeon]